MFWSGVSLQIDVLRDPDQLISSMEKGCLFAVLGGAPRSAWSYLSMGITHRRFRFRFTINPAINRRCTCRFRVGILEVMSLMTTVVIPQMENQETLLRQCSKGVELRRWRHLNPYYFNTWLASVSCLSFGPMWDFKLYWI